jgi:lipopolysaccharide transport system ATP-binding protein
LGGPASGYGRLTESLVAAIRPRGDAAGGPAGTGAFLWALNEITFDVEHGEVVGLIGRNGSGKTTLLKILSRITEPTAGYADVTGRVGSLLEVGTGFHPELTGRENIYLNGAILGMGKSEVKSKFDEIVAFAEIEKFLATPVKRYSSGMYVRLAFAVAAHLETEILLVDEVLAVGDLAFQKKCLAKIGDVASAGRTVLFVSHNMSAVESLCSRVVLLRDGALDFDGSPADAVGRYVGRGDSATPIVELGKEAVHLGTGEGRITGLRLVGTPGQDDLRVCTGGPLTIRIDFSSGDYSGNVGAGVLVRDRFERFLCDVRSVHAGVTFNVSRNASYGFQVSLPHFPLYPGEYAIGVFVAKPMGEDVDYVPDACTLMVEDDGSLVVEGRLDPKWGQVFVAGEWSEVPAGA